MRDDNEIVARIQDVADRDWMGTIRGDLMRRLEFSKAKQFLRNEALAELWSTEPRDHENVMKEMRDYMAFAWDKANNNRGLSAGRSLEHMSAWLWLLGETAAADALDGFTHYGKPQLRAICERFGWDWESWDDGRWTSQEEAEGEPPLAAADLPWNDA